MAFQFLDSRCKEKIAQLLHFLHKRTWLPACIEYEVTPSDFTILGFVLLNTSVKSKSGFKNFIKCGFA